MKAILLIAERLSCWTCGKTMLSRYAPNPARTVVYCGREGCQNYNINHELPIVELERSK